MGSHCNPMAFNLRVAFLRGRRWVMHYASMQFGHLLYKQQRNQEGWGLQTSLAKSLKNFNQKYKRLNLFWAGPEIKRGWAILKFAMQKSNSMTSHAVVHSLQSTIVSNSFYRVGTSHNFWLMLANQLWADHFGTWLIAKLFTRFIKSCGLAVRTSNITKLRTCGCGLQKLRSCGLAVADFKNYEVADLR